jgi:hypothetical protein
MNIRNPKTDHIVEPILEAKKKKPAKERVSLFLKVYRTAARI